MFRLFSTVMALLLIFAQGANLQARRSQSHKSGVYSSRSHRSVRPHTARRSSVHHHRTRIKRSSAAKHDFMRRTGYPHGRPGYIEQTSSVTHVLTLSNCSRRGRISFEIYSPSMLRSGWKAWNEVM